MLGKTVSANSCAQTAQIEALGAEAVRMGGDRDTPEV